MNTTKLDHRLLGMFVLLVALLCCLPLGTVFAADILVDADCSLQNAVRSANGQPLAEPRMDCEPGDSEQQVPAEGEVQLPGYDQITITLEGTEDGRIAVDSPLDISSHIAIDGGGFSLESMGNRLFDVTSSSLTLSNITLTGGYSEGNGGAVRVRDAALTMRNSAVSASRAVGSGGGIYAFNSHVQLHTSAVTDNVAGDRHEESAHAHNADELSAQAEAPLVQQHAGGGIYFEGVGVELRITESGISNNEALEAGGGLYIHSGKVQIENSTISGNRAGSSGGGVHNDGDATLVHVTISGNSASNGGGVYDGATLQLYNSLLSDNSGGDCEGALNGNIGNLIRDGSCNHDGTSEDPNLLQLVGAPDYFQPQSGSAAIDGAASDYCLPQDQRGLLRVAESCDIGAAEFEAGAFSFQIQSVQTARLEAASVAVEPPGRPTAAPSICEQLPPHMLVSDYDHNVHCKALGIEGVGNATLTDYGVIYVMDIFGYLAQPVKACFRHDSGTIVMLDAANSPRNIVPLRTRSEGVMKCATVDRPGTLVLMPREFLWSGAIPEPRWSLEGCTVVASTAMNLRQEPSLLSAALATVPQDIVLGADRVNGDWYRVDFYGKVGWLNRNYLSMSDNCG